MNLPQPGDVIPMKWGRTLTVKAVSEWTVIARCEDRIYANRYTHEEWATLMATEAVIEDAA